MEFPDASKMLKPALRSWLLACLCVVMPAQAQDDKDTGAVRDLAYGTALYEFYQQHYY